MSVIKKNEYVLRILAEDNPQTTTYIICGAGRPVIPCFVDWPHNILEGNIPLELKEKERLGKYKEELQALRKKNISDRKKETDFARGWIPACFIGSYFKNCYSSTC